MKQTHLFRHSVDMDPILLEQLGVAQRVCLAVVGLVAGVTLAARFIPLLGRILLTNWGQMAPNTSLVALVSVLSLMLSQPKRTKRMVLISRLAGVFVGTMGVAVLVEFGFHLSLGLDTLLPVVYGAVPLPGRMAPQTATSFTLLAVVLFFLRERKKALSVFADVVVCGLCAMVLIGASGYVYGAIRLFAVSHHNRMALSTLVCLILLCFVAFARRAEYGVFGILLSTGIAGRIARIAFPIAFALPFALEAARVETVKTGLLGPQYASALETTVAVLLASGLILIMLLRIRSLEREIRNLSLRDELTALYNRRGFYLLAEQALRLAQRSNAPFSVLFVDLDNLKLINDTRGHGVGSEFLCEVAELLQRYVRKSDVLGRVGGDEFVVAGQSTEEAMRHVTQRLEEAARERNAQPGRTYPFSFSVGHVTTREDEAELLQDLLERADHAMYITKRHKKAVSR
jgi:diguanylate cyclase (GGDEF)-like protein